MSGQNPNDQNQRGDPYQLIYQDTQNPFANSWDAETRRMEFQFLGVSAIIEEATHRLVLQNAAGRDFSFGFLNHGEMVSHPTPNTLYLAVGNRFCEGMLDHHQWEKHPEQRRIVRNNTSASMVYKFPEKLTDTTEGENPNSMKIYLPKQPDFDAVSAAYLAVYYLIRHHFPIGGKFISDYARMQDEGNTPYLDKFPLTTCPSAVLYIANNRHKDYLRKYKETGNITSEVFENHISNLMLLNGLAVLDRIFAEFNGSKKLTGNAPSHYYNKHIHKLFSHKIFHPFANAIRKDYLKYLEDVKQSETYIVTVQVDDVKDLCKLMWKMIEKTGHQRNKQLIQILENRIPRLSNPNDEKLSDTFDRMLAELAPVEGKSNDDDESLQKLLKKLRQLKQKTDSGRTNSETKTAHNYINAEMILLENPGSLLFKEWARSDSLHYSKEIKGKQKGFEIIFCTYTGNDIPMGHRFIISADPRLNITLENLGRELQREEQRCRQQTHLYPLGERNRPGYNSPDPWFDGRGTIMEDTIVDSPAGGTLIGKEQVKEIVLHEFKTQENIFSGNLCFVSKVNIGNLNINRLKDYSTVLEQDKRLPYDRYFYCRFYDFLSDRFLWLDSSKLKKAGIDAPLYLEENPRDKGVRVELQGIQLLQNLNSSAVLSIDYKITSRSGLDVFPFTDNLSSHIYRRINEEINKKIYHSFGGSEETPEQHMLTFFKIGDGKQFYETGRKVQESTGAYTKIFQQKSSFSIPKQNQYNEFYIITQLIAMYAFFLKEYIISIDSEIENHMKKDRPSLKEIESLRQSLIRFLSQDYSVETASLGRYSEIWKRFLKKFEIDKYIEEAKWQCTEISNYYIENQSFKTNMGVAILSWFIAPIGIVLGILQLNDDKLEPQTVWNWSIDPTLFWLGLTLLTSFSGYAIFKWCWPWIQKTLKNN